MSLRMCQISARHEFSDASRRAEVADVVRAMAERMTRPARLAAEVLEALCLSLPSLRRLQQI